MNFEKNTYIKKDGIFYRGVLNDVKKSGNFLQPILEAVTNSLEAIDLRSDKTNNGFINIKIISKKQLHSILEFEKIIIEDNGIGFNDENFERALVYKDTRKGFNNKGSGRLQLVHFFTKSEYTSIYFDKIGHKKRTFNLSKSEPFLNENSIVFYEDTIDVDNQEPNTTLTLNELITGSENYYNSLNAIQLKDELISRYMLYFCSHRDKMPKITIQHIAGSDIINEETIESSDIPEFDKELPFSIYYSEHSGDGKSIISSTNKEDFKIKAFKIEKNKLEKNAIKLTSKSEIVDSIKIPLSCLLPEDHIEGYRYLFLLSGDYLDSRDSDTRGNFKIPTYEDFKKQNDLFSTEEILLEDITEAVNIRALSMYNEIQKKSEEHKLEIEKLKSMFLLNDETLKHLSISLNDTEDKILEKVYAAEAKVEAKKDAEIKQKIDELENLDPTSEQYEQSFDNAIIELVKQIPIQNRTTLTHYIARRKLVLELFDKILKRKLKIQNSGGKNIDEKLLHDLIFQQSTQSPDQSDLWVVNEDFIYFKGTSESKLKDVTIEGKKILKEQLTPEEEQYSKSLGENREAKRPDILLFPNEGKCIIIEFKNPNVNLSEHLNQINRYASLIRNLSKDEYKFDTFYGYLIGEKLDPDDVRDFDSDFKHSSHFDYVFRPSKPITGKFGRNDGSIYLEVLKYSTLLERAQMRNSIFLSKIQENNI